MTISRIAISAVSAVIAATTGQTGRTKCQMNAMRPAGGGDSGTLR